MRFGRRGYGVGALVAVLAAVSCSPAPGATSAIPSFEVDRNWPQPFAENWVFGSVTGVAVDSRGHIWVTHAPSTASNAALGAAQDPPISTCCVPAPDIIEFDRDGNVVQAWDMSNGDWAWPDVPHGLFVDHDDNLWVGSRPHNQVLKFDRDGELLLTIGELDEMGGSNDPDRLGRPADVWVDPDTNEAFIADGYGNRRIVVYDGETGEYLRHWGAYGETPDDEYEYGSRDADAAPARQFGTVHGLTGSRDGMIYVADRRNNRVQVFRQDGEFVDEKIVAAGTLASGSAFDVALSADPDQEFLYLMDGTNHKIWILRRADLEVVGDLGRGGFQVGQFIRPHNMDADDEGHIYTSEAETMRVQRFLFQGTPTP